MQPVAKLLSTHCYCSCLCGLASSFLQQLRDFRRGIVPFMPALMSLHCTGQETMVEKHQDSQLTQVQPESGCEMDCAVHACVSLYEGYRNLHVIQGVTLLFR